MADYQLLRYECSPLPIAPYASGSGPKWRTDTEPDVAPVCDLPGTCAWTSAAFLGHHFARGAGRRDR